MDPLDKDVVDYLDHLYFHHLIHFIDSYGFIDLHLNLIGHPR